MYKTQAGFSNAKVHGLLDAAHKNICGHVVTGIHGVPYDAMNDFSRRENDIDFFSTAIAAIAAKEKVR